MGMDSEEEERVSKCAGMREKEKERRAQGRERGRGGGE